MSKLTGKVAVVTGASKGIGAAIAKSLAAEGASVVVNYASSKAGAGTVVAAITAAGGKAVAVGGDVSKAAEAQGTIEAAIQNYGRLDILVNNAGVAAIYPSLELPLEEWKRVLDVNLTGVFLCAQEAAREMIRVKAGVILNIASAYGVVAAPKRAAYCATKAAVAMLTKVLAIEWARDGLRVNAIAPGYVQTEMVLQYVEQKKIDLESLRRGRRRVVLARRRRSPKWPFSSPPISPLTLLGKLLEWMADGRPMVTSNSSKARR